MHAGDIGSSDVLTALTAIAPVTAVRGNDDRGSSGRPLSDSAAVQAGDARLDVLHDVHDLDLDPKAAGFAAVIAGHSHRPEITKRDGVVYANPGTPGRHVLRCAVAVARLHVRADSGVHGQIILVDRVAAGLASSGVLDVGSRHGNWRGAPLPRGLSIFSGGMLTSYAVMEYKGNVGWRGRMRRIKRPTKRVANTGQGGFGFCQAAVADGSRAQADR